MDEPAADRTCANQNAFVLPSTDIFVRRPPPSSCILPN